MHWFLYIATGFILAYAIRIISYLYGWKILHRNTLSAPSSLPGVSVVIPFRNEEGMLPGLLEDLVAQDYPSGLFEVILVDDHSTDLSAEAVIRITGSLPNFSMASLENGKRGKREALRTGIGLVRREIILTSDADCRVGPGWIRSMAGSLEDTAVHMVLGAVILEPGRKLFSRMQSLEFFSLIASTAGAAGIGRPVLSNAACMAFKKVDYMEYIQGSGQPTPSGDDMFLMLWVKKHRPGSIRFNPSLQAVVRTPPMDSPGSFFSQRIRWTSKSPRYRDPELIITAILVYMASLCLLAALAAGIFRTQYLWLFPVLLGTKALADLAILYPVLSYFGYRKLLWLFLPLEIIYFMYVSVTGVAGLIIPFSWKGRRKMQ